MKCLTIRQPYAWAIMLGEKTIENRSQAWKYRGPIAVHAGLAYSQTGHDEAMSLLGFCPPPGSTIPGAMQGAILGAVDLVDIHEGWDGCCAPWGHRGSRAHLELANPRLLPEPIPCRGQLGLWTPPEPILAALLEFEAGRSASDTRTPCLSCGRSVSKAYWVFLDHHGPLHEVCRTKEQDRIAAREAQP